MRLAVLGAVALMALASCGGRSDTAWMPMTKSSTWKYEVQNGMQRSVETIKVEARDLVGGQNGWRLEGPGGPSRLAWIDGNMYASQLAGTRFSPPILINSDTKDPKFNHEWKGDIMVAHRSMPATATVHLEEDTMTLGGKDVKTQKSVLAMKVGKMEVGIQTWFAKGIGIVRQEERSGDLLLRSMEYISGP